MQRIEAVDDENPFTIRAVVKVREKYKNDRLYGVWDILDDKAFMKKHLALGSLILDQQDNFHQESA